ncbi:uncharacterized protein AB675_4923 [Cyphellophora attinorum]|uniref:Uncharacterized protein n=1 Tax=Cyphellophora attinorum TaxID=1664694 RepID=A0A0N1NXN2_9EURO|nr:uncharacterized protein AB675_4923 [Phialophora attinorum]KPI34596.1 hypothetical protein AB675_4923 [Phialophora attinorum]
MASLSRSEEPAYELLSNRLVAPHSTPAAEAHYADFDDTSNDAAVPGQKVEAVHKAGSSPCEAWEPGILARLPWQALLSLIGVILGLVAVIFVLVYSDGKAIDDWYWQPSIYIAIALVVVNPCLVYSLSSGATIWWWRQASAGTTVRELHHSWAYGHSVLEALTAGKRMNYLALSCIMVTIAQLNNPLLQRASSPVVQPTSNTIPLSLKSATEVPMGYTGVLSGRGRWPARFSGNFSDIVNDWNNLAPIPYPTPTCKGTCRAVIDSIGFDVNCTSSTVPFDLEPTSLPNGTVITNEFQIFESNFFWSDGEDTSNVIRLNIANKQTQNCNGEIQIQNCTLHPAQVSTHVLIDGNASTIALDPAFNIDDDVVIKPDNRSERVDAGPSTIGGIYLALNNNYESDASNYFTAGSSLYFLTTHGNTALQYLIQESTRSVSTTGCELAFSDPKNDILAGSRDLFFRLAMAAANESTPVQNVMAQQELNQAVFSSDYAFMAGGVAVTAVALLMVSGLFLGYQNLGRPVSLSPVEIAKAFDAPLLKYADNNAGIEKLVHETGAREVKYGVLRGGDGMGEKDGAGRKLIMGEKGSVRRPMPGETFTG